MLIHSFVFYNLLPAAVAGLTIVGLGVLVTMELGNLVTIRDVDLTEHVLRSRTPIEALSITTPDLFYN